MIVNLNNPREGFDRGFCVHAAALPGGRRMEVNVCVDTLGARKAMADRARGRGCSSPLRSLSGFQLS